jgi:hypothetical protein
MAGARWHLLFSMPRLSARQHNGGNNSQGTYCRGGSGLRGGSGWRDGGDEGGLGDAGGRDGSGSRAGMKLPPKRKAMPSNDHSFPFALRTFSRVVMATTVRFSFRAIEGLSIFEFSRAKSCASSAGVHGRPLGCGPSFISLSDCARPAGGWFRPFFCNGAAAVHKLLGGSAEARGLFRRRSCRPRASRPAFFARRRSTAAAVVLKRPFAFTSAPVRPYQRSVRPTSR